MPRSRGATRAKPGATNEVWEADGFLPIDSTEPVGATFGPIKQRLFSADIYWKGHDGRFWWPSKARRYLDCPACARCGGRNKLSEQEEAVMRRGKLLHQMIAGEKTVESGNAVMESQAEFARSYLGRIRKVSTEIGLAFQTLIGGREVVGAATIDAMGEGEIVEFKSRMPQGGDKTHLALQLGIESWAYQAGGRGWGEPRMTVLDLAQKKVWRFEGANYDFLAGTIYYLGQMEGYPLNPECGHTRLQKGRVMLDGFGLRYDYTDRDWVCWQKARKAAELFCQSGKWIAETGRVTRLPKVNPARVSFEEETERLWADLDRS